MAIRIRVVSGITLALCAVETDAKPGDIYLDDAQDHALRVKFIRDYKSEGIDLNQIRYEMEDALAEGEKARDAGEELRKWQELNLQCDCENPEPARGAALVSNSCPVHNLYPRPLEE